MEDSKIKIPSPLLNTFPGQHGTVQLWRWGAGSKLGLKVRRNSTITQMDPKLEFQPPYQKKKKKKEMEDSRIRANIYLRNRYKGNLYIKENIRKIGDQKGVFTNQEKKKEI